MRYLPEQPREQTPGLGFLVSTARVPGCSQRARSVPTLCSALNGHCLCLWPWLCQLYRDSESRALPSLHTWAEAPFRHPSALEVGRGPLVQKQRPPFLLKQKQRRPSCTSVGWKVILMWAVFNVFIEFVTIWLLYYILVFWL